MRYNKTGSRSSSWNKDEIDPSDTYKALETLGNTIGNINVGMFVLSHPHATSSTQMGDFISACQEKHVPVLRAESHLGQVAVRKAYRIWDFPLVRFHVNTIFFNIMLTPL